ncbi:hypothetical protein [Persicobacter diffluens]|uniref:Uncharacterized protein n=1 Tax=Persicobacter diffluens TaxID=981 RepID=A0AAN4VY31_9BACT|nr:hypothetical protein PEDI_14840 [Persicobacter diffluens]
MTFNQGVFSKRWVVLSFVIFVAVELFLGKYLAEMLAGRIVSVSLRYQLQGGLNLISYLCGGFIIGIISPGVRILEPAVGAFLAVALMLIVSVFTPYSFIYFSLSKLLIGGGIAFFLALIGAHYGERLMGN